MDINSPTAEELQIIVHIGPERADQIIALRPFDSVNGLLEVSGIGPATLADIKALATCPTSSIALIRIDHNPSSANAFAHLRGTSLENSLEK